MASPRNTILYIATSLDGFIAPPDDSLDWLSAVAREGEDYGYFPFYETVDTLIVGRRTYDIASRFDGGFPHAKKECYVITSKPQPAQGSVQFYSGDLRALVASLKSHEGGTIFIDGGAGVVNSMLKDDLIDEFVISTIPVLLGSGIRLFGEGNPRLPLRLVSSKAYESGLVQSRYLRERS